MATEQPDQGRWVRERLRTARRQRDLQAEAEAEGKASPACDPREVLRSVLEAAGKWTRPTPPSRAWLLQWLVQQGPEQFLGTGSALLLLRIVSYLGGKAGTAWIGRGTLAVVAGKSRKAIDRHAVALTHPWQIARGRNAAGPFPPLFRLQLKGWGKARLVHWVPVEAGWIPFLERLTTATDSGKARLRAARTRQPPE